jgi:hypothetical protein
VQEAHSIDIQKHEGWSNQLSCHEDAEKEYHPERVKEGWMLIK